MKKKAYLAVSALCLAFAFGGCGEAETADNTQNETQEEAKEESTEEETDTQEESAASGTRLVTVENVEKYVTIGQYTGLTLDNTVEEITDNDVEATILQTLKSAAQEVTNGTVENGDTVTIDYVGTIDGEDFEGGQKSSYELEIGSGVMLMPEFEEGIIGMAKGETKKLTLTFPEDYLQSELAGQEAVFQITLQSFKRPAELTDEWVAQNTDYTTVDEYRAGVKQELQANADQAAMDSLAMTAWSTVLSNSEVMEYPEEDIEAALAEFEKETKSYAEDGGMEVEEFLETQGISLEDYEEQCRQYAEYKVKQNLIVQGIMDKEGISLEDEECLAIQDELVALYGAKDLADLIDTYGQAAVNESVGLLRVEDFIIENATISDGTEAAAEAVSGDGGDSENGITESTQEEAQGAEDEILQEGDTSKEATEDMDAVIED